MDSRSEVKEFLASRRARVTPEAAALLAGVSVDYYVRLERGNLHGVSEQVLDALESSAMFCSGGPSLSSTTQTSMVGSPQTLSEANRRILAAWAADCADRVLGLFEAEAPGDHRPRDLIARARAFSQGDLNTAEEIRRRFVGGVSSREVKAPAAMAAARAAGQAVGICHMGAHALGAAAYAAMAAGLADPEEPEAVEDEVCWQLEHMSASVRDALRTLPPVGEDSSGPLGPGLLASGQLGSIIRRLQAGLSHTDPV